MALGQLFVLHSQSASGLLELVDVVLEVRRVAPGHPRLLPHQMGEGLSRLQHHGALGGDHLVPDGVVEVCNLRTSKWDIIDQQNER